MGNTINAGWNTYANLHNFYTALEVVPDKWANVSDYFGGGGSSSSSSDGDSKGKVILLLVAIAVLGGILTTWSIIAYSARSAAFKRRYKYMDDGLREKYENPVPYWEKPGHVRAVVVKGRRPNDLPDWRR